MTLAGFSAPFWKALLGKLQLFGLWLSGFGVFGVLLLAYVDSVIPLTPIPDATLALLCAQGTVWWWWAAALAALGSSLGCMTVYWIVRRLRQRFLGRSLLARRLSPERQARIEQLIRQYDIVALAAAAVMPPPFPFKPFVICAGLLEFHQGRLFVGLFIGRAIRYGTLAYLSMRYGSEAMSLLQQHTGWFSRCRGHRRHYQHLFPRAVVCLPPSGAGSHQPVAGHSALSHPDGRLTMNFLRYGCSSFLALGGLVVAFLALYDAFQPNRHWGLIAGMFIGGVVAFLGGTAVIEMANASRRRRGEAEAAAWLPRLAAEHGVITVQMIEDRTLSATQTRRWLEREVAAGRLERLGPERYALVAVTSPSDSPPSDRA